MAHKHLTDLDTAHRIAKGDAWATEAFVTAHYASLLRFMRHLTRHAEDAEDLTQQAFVKAKQRIASYRGNASLRTWLYRVALHEYTHWRRKHRRTHTLESAPPSVEPAYEACLEAAALLDALHRLPETLRTTFLLHEVQELSVEETARALGLPKGTVKSRLFHARRQLSVSLTGQQEDEIEAQPAYEV